MCRSQLLYLWFGKRGGKPRWLAHIWWKIDRWHRRTADQVIVLRTANPLNAFCYCQTCKFWGVWK